MFMFSRILDRGCVERERGNRDGAKGEGVPGRALTAAPASCGSAFDRKSTDCTQGEGTD